MSVAISVDSDRRGVVVGGDAGSCSIGKVTGRGRQLLARSIGYICEVSLVVPFWTCSVRCRERL
jgi:hypothetical protein